MVLSLELYLCLGKGRKLKSPSSWELIYLSFFTCLCLPLYLQASELPLEELLALYGYTVSNPEKDTCHMAAHLPNMSLNKVRYSNREHRQLLTYLLSHLLSSIILFSCFYRIRYLRISFLGRRKKNHQLMNLLPQSHQTIQMCSTTHKVLHAKTYTDIQYYTKVLGHHQLCWFKILQRPYDYFTVLLLECCQKVQAMHMQNYKMKKKSSMYRLQWQLFRVTPPYV